MHRLQLQRLQAPQTIEQGVGVGGDLGRPGALSRPTRRPNSGSLTSAGCDSPCDHQVLPRPTAFSPNGGWSGRRGLGPSRAQHQERRDQAVRLRRPRSRWRVPRQGECQHRVRAAIEQTCGARSRLTSPRPPGDGKHAGAGEFHQAERTHSGDELVDLRGTPVKLEHKAFVSVGRSHGREDVRHPQPPPDRRRCRAP